MAIQEYEPQGQPQPIPERFTIWEEVVEDTLFRHLGQKAIEPHVLMDGRDLGILHWYEDEIDRIGFIDGIDTSDSSEAMLSSEDWQALAIYMHGLPRYKAARLIEHPGGQSRFFEAL